jgi:hypothetical protein
MVFVHRNVTTGLAVEIDLKAPLLQRRDQLAAPVLGEVVADL